MFKAFKGGIHPKDMKQLTEAMAIETMPVPEKLIIPIRQHIGAPATPVVAKGDQVKRGQLIAAANGFVSSNIHASTSGQVVEIAELPNPTYGKCLSIVIESDGQDQWLEGLPTQRDWTQLTPETMITLIQEAGIVGMGGASFPTHVKLSPPKEANIDTFILNAAECEPYLTADHRTLIENAQKVITGMLIIQKIIAVDQLWIGIEDNKKDAIDVMEKLCQGTGIRVAALQTKYPQGAEKMLIKAICNREVPSGKLPTDVGVVVHNVGTAVAITDAVCSGLPLTQRVTTISGRAVKNPKNLSIRIGTSFSDVIAYCGGLHKPVEKIVTGGPMMGMAQATTDLPVTKGISGILCLVKGEVNETSQKPCIRCGRCVEVCPIGLVPAMFGILGEKDLYEEAKDAYNLLDCAECGCCVYVCPSKRNLVQYVKYFKFKNATIASK